MTIEAGLVAHLGSDSAVKALVASRIYPMVIPQDVTLPAMAYQRISGPRDHAHDGATGLAVARMQLTFVAASYSATKALAAAVRQAIDGYKGSMGTVEVGACLLDNEIDSWAAAFDKPVVRHDYSIWYSET